MEAHDTHSQEGYLMNQDAMVPISVLLFLPALACSGDEAPGASPEAAKALETQVVPVEAMNIAEPSDRIAQISDIAVADDGTVWVLNTTAPFFMAMSAEGEVLSYRGTRGEGPGEFRAPNNLLRAGLPGYLWAYDSRARRLTRIDGPEGETEELLVPLSSDPPSFLVWWEDNPSEAGGRRWIGGREDGFLFAHSTGDFEESTSVWDFEVVRLATDSSASILISSADLLGDPATRFGKMRAFLPFPIWTTCPDGSMALYDPLTNSVRRLTADGTEIGSHGLPPERRLEMTMERLWPLFYRVIMAAAEGPDAGGLPPDSAMLYEMMKGGIAEEGGLSEAASDVFPEYRSLACGGSDGSLWLQIFDMESRVRWLADGPEWLRIGPDGAIRRIVFPESFSPLRFTDDRIWGSHRDELEIESVAWIATPE